MHTPFLKTREERKLLVSVDFSGDVEDYYVDIVATKRNANTRTLNETMQFRMLISNLLEHMLDRLIIGHIDGMVSD